MDRGWIRTGLAALLGCGCSIGVDDSPFSNAQPGAYTSAGGDEGSTGVMTTGGTDGPSDPGGTTDGPGDTMDAPESGDGGSSSSGGWNPGGDDGGSTTATIDCGNGVVEGDESCDGVDLGGMTCADVGDFVGGTLACDALCAFDTSGCTVAGGGPASVCQFVGTAIPEFGTATAVVAVPDGGSISDVTVAVDITHSWISDLTVEVEHNGTSVLLFDHDCSFEVNMDLVFDDAGAGINCGFTTSGAATSPAQPLSAFDGVDASGNWTFTVVDTYDLDSGTINEVCLNIEF